MSADSKSTFCTVPGCGRPHRARGYCRTHYARWRASGDARPEVPIGAVRRAQAAEPTPVVAHPVALKRRLRGLPPVSRHERLLALADLAERAGAEGWDARRFEREQAKVLGGRQ